MLHGAPDRKFEKGLREANPREGILHDLTWRAKE